MPRSLIPTLTTRRNARGRAGTSLVFAISNPAGAPPGENEAFDTLQLLTDVAHVAGNQVASRNMQMHVIVSIDVEGVTANASLPTRPFTDLLDDVPRVELARDLEALVEDMQMSFEDISINENTTITINLQPDSHTGGCAGSLETTQNETFYFPRSKDDYCLVESLYYCYFLRVLWPTTPSMHRSNETPSRYFVTRYSGAKLQKILKDFFVELVRSFQQRLPEVDRRSMFHMIPMFQSFAKIEIVVEDEPDALGECELHHFAAWNGDMMKSWPRMSLLLRDGHFFVRRNISSLTTGVKRKGDALVKRNNTERNVRENRIQKAFGRSCVCCRANTELQLGKNAAKEDHGSCGRCGLPRCHNKSCGDDHKPLCNLFFCEACVHFFPSPEERMFHQECMKTQCSRCKGMFPAVMRSKSLKKGAGGIVPAMFPTIGLRQLKEVTPHNCVMEGKQHKPFTHGLMAYDLETAPDANRMARMMCVSITYLRYDEETVEYLNSKIGLGNAKDENAAALMEKLTSNPVITESFVGREEFMKFVQRLLAGEWRGFAIAAHNGSRFDAPILLDFIVKNCDSDVVSDVSIVRDGPSIKQLVYPKVADKKEKEDGTSVRLPPRVRLIDSIAHIPMPLGTFAKSFGLPIAKGDFPFSVLSAYEDWKTRVLPTIPPLEAFKEGTDKKWHAEQVAKGEPYDIKKELLKYCELDTKVQLEGMVRMMKEVCCLYVEQYQTFFDQFSYMTGAAAAFDALVLMSLSQNPLGVPATPHRAMENYIYRSGVKLALLMKEALPDRAWEGCALTGQPIRLGKGLDVHAVDLSTNTAYRVLSCAHTGCRKCFTGLAARDEEKAGTEIALEEEEEEEDGEEGEEVGEEVRDRKISASARVDFRSSSSKCRYLTVDEAESMAKLGRRFLGSIYAHVFDFQQCEVEEMWLSAKMKSIRGKCKKLAVPKRFSCLSVDDAYRGGYTAPSGLYYKCADDEIMRMRDFTSLYPYTMTFEYPLGVAIEMDFSPQKRAADGFARSVHGKCLRANRLEDHVRGIARITIAVNQSRLQHVLCHSYKEERPYRSEDHADRDAAVVKLCASACFACGGKQPLKDCEHAEMLFCETCEDKDKCPHVTCCAACQTAHMSAPCEHSKEERAFTGTWTTAEIDLALSEGDELLDLHEAHHFEKWGPCMRDFVFVNYIGKELASPWAADIVTDSQKAEAWEETQKACEKLFGKRMPHDWKEKTSNPVKRQTHKIIMNSCYGKLGEKVIKKQNVMSAEASEIRDLVKKFRYALRLDFIIKGDDPEVDDGISMMSFRCRESNSRMESCTSKYLAAYVTGYARMELYKEMIKRGGRVLMCDTDSVLYVTSKAAAAKEEEPPAFLGAFALEEGKDCVEYASLGPKTYAIRKADGSEIVKCKGVRASSSKRWGVKAYKEVLLGEAAALTSTQVQFMAVSNCEGLGVRISDDFHRRIRLTSAKRQMLPPVYENGELKCILTVPFGYQGRDPYADILELRSQ